MYMLEDHHWKPLKQHNCQQHGVGAGMSHYLIEGNGTYIHLQFILTQTVVWDFETNERSVVAHADREFSHVEESRSGEDFRKRSLFVRHLLAPHLAPASLHRLLQAPTRHHDEAAPLQEDPQAAAAEQVW